ncbi:ABC transporter permease [Haploplasma modicum]|uniref:ABC transporter permease n=1 Tax=Haploplasma modicum TaxID=2150 RepID=UPI00214AC5B6|nr:ABC transporter permease [Haploplasma modicum]MCR1808747.1 ABC transporter permease [Haploplasma modicum]
MPLIIDKFKKNKDEESKIKKTILSNNSTLLGIPYYILLFGLIVFPFFIMVLYAFSSTSGSIFQIEFTLKNFAMFFNEKLFVKTMFESLYLAALSTVFTLLVGYPLAYFITKQSRRKQALLIALITSTMWVNMLIRANALKQVTEMFAPKLLGTDFIIILGNVYMFLPFMVLPIYTILSRIDKSLLQGAADLGATPLQTFRRVVLPLSLSGVVSGSMMVFLPAATTLIVPKYLGDGKRILIGKLIEDAVLQSHNYGYGAAVSIVIGVILIGFIVLLKKVDKYDEVLSNEED